jgi:putative transposase
MLRAFKYRLWTNSAQERELATMLESHRRLYNACLDLRTLAYEFYGASVDYCDCSRWFKHQRLTNPYFARLNFSSAQATMRRLDKSYAHFFRRVKEGAAEPGFPKFKGRDYFGSIEFPCYREGHIDGVRLTGNRLYTQHVGTIRVKLHRPIEGKIKTVALKREAGKWYAVFSCELPDVPLKASTLPPVGIDVGLTHFLTDSDGRTEPNPRYLKTALPALRRAGRSVARKKKGGTNRRRAVHRLQKVHARVRNVRREHHTQVARRLVLAHGLIAAESLNIQGMLGNRRLSRAISDAGWSGFLNVLRSQAEKAGAQFVDVDARGTSQECSGCHQEVRKDLSVRWHDCLRCGLSLDRDHNAALNILARGLLARTEPAGPKRYLSAVRRSRRVHATE